MIWSFAGLYLVFKVTKPQKKKIKKSDDNTLESPKTGGFANN